MSISSIQLYRALNYSDIFRRKLFAAAKSGKLDNKIITKFALRIVYRFV